MKVKGWVVVEENTRRIHYFKYNKISAINKVKELELFCIKPILVKPCTITIHDKAVKG